MKKKVIIFIPGIFNPKWYQTFWRQEAKKEGFEFIEFENPRYSYWSIKEMKGMIQEGVEIFEKYKNDELIVICHSFGGILINCILQKVKNYNIEKMFILASPLQMQWFGMKKRKEELGYDNNFSYKTKVFTFGGYIDPIVGFFVTKYKSEKHKNVLGEHMYFLFSKRFIRKILSSIK